jgi:TM2 domain-containing membrane protein YozV
MTNLPTRSPAPLEISDKSRLVALLLAGVLGVFGAHRFYVKRTNSGALMALTLGGLGIWYLYDLIVIAGGGFKDAEGRAVLSWELDEQVERPHSLSLPDEVLDELDRLRQEVADLSERVDFTERLLADPQRGERNRSEPPREG